MFNPIEMRRRMVQERIEKSFDNEIEKAHKDGDMHPNGKWVWVSSAAGGKGDWRTINGRARQKHNAAHGSASGGNTPEDKEYAEKFKRNFKDASDDILNKVISGKIQAADADKRLAKEILDERKSSAEGEKYAAKIIDLLKVSSNKYSDIKKVTAFKTDKGNWAIDYDGANTGIILNGSRLSEKGLKAAGVKIEGGSSNGNEKKADKKSAKSNTYITPENADGYVQKLNKVLDMKGYFAHATKSGSIEIYKKGDRKALKNLKASIMATDYINWGPNKYLKDKLEPVIKEALSSSASDANKKDGDWNDNVGGKKKTESYASMDIKDAKKPLTSYQKHAINSLLNQPGWSMSKAEKYVRTLSDKEVRRLAHKDM